MIIVRKNHHKRNENKSATIVQISCLLLLWCWNSPRIHNFTKVIKIEIEIKQHLPHIMHILSNKTSTIMWFTNTCFNLVFTYSCCEGKKTNLCVAALCLNFGSTQTKQQQLNQCDKMIQSANNICSFDIITTPTDRPLFVSCLTEVWISVNQYWLFDSILILCGFTSGMIKWRCTSDKLITIDSVTYAYISIISLMLY